MRSLYRTSKSNFMYSLKKLIFISKELLSFENGYKQKKILSTEVYFTLKCISISNSKSVYVCLKKVSQFFLVRMVSLVPRLFIAIFLKGHKIQRMAILFKNKLDFKSFSCYSKQLFMLKLAKVIVNANQIVFVQP